jgi:hypothetical protein
LKQAKILNENTQKYLNLPIVEIAGQDVSFYNLQIRIEVG